LLSLAPRFARRARLVAPSPRLPVAPSPRRPVAQAVRAAAAWEHVRVELLDAEATAERDLALGDKALKQARSASAVAVAVASSLLSSTRQTSIGASSASQTARTRKFQKSIGPLIKLDQPSDQRQDSTLAAVIGEPPILQFPLQLIELLFEHADSAANATIFFDALRLMVGEF